MGAFVNQLNVLYDRAKKVCKSSALITMVPNDERHDSAPSSALMFAMR